MDVGVFDGVASGHHHAVSEVDAAMAHSGGVISAGEKHQVSGLGCGVADVLALVPQAIGGGASDVITSLIVDPADIAGAVETGGGVFATPDVVVAHILQGKFHHRIRLRPAVGIHGVLHPSLKGQVRPEEHSQGLLALGAALGKQLLAVTLDDPQLHQKAGAGEGVAAQLSGVGEVVEDSHRRTGS